MVDPSGRVWVKCSKLQYSQIYLERQTHTERKRDRETEFCWGRMGRTWSCYSWLQGWALFENQRRALKDLMEKSFKYFWKIKLLIGRWMKWKLEASQDMTTVIQKWIIIIQRDRSTKKWEKRKGNRLKRCYQGYVNRTLCLGNGGIAVTRGRGALSKTPGSWYELAGADSDVRRQWDWLLLTPLFLGNPLSIQPSLFFPLPPCLLELFRSGCYEWLKYSPTLAPFPGPQMAFSYSKSSAYTQRWVTGDISYWT